MTRSLLTPAMAGVLENIRRAKKPPFHAMGVAEARRFYAASAEVLDLPRAALPRVEDIDLPLPGRTLRARLYAAAADALPVLLYFHGGGFTIGGLGTHDSLCRQLASRAGCAVLALDYRLAPEHRFPAAVDDAFEALGWLASNGAALGVDAARLAVGGDSAGGTLAAAAALHARDTGLRLAGQLLITPGTGALADTASHRLFANGFLLDAATIEWFFEQYIDRHERHDWRFAPLEADDLDGVAPAAFVLAECDPLVDEGLAYADRLRASGVAVQLDLHRGVVHDFIKMGRVIREADGAQAFAAAFLRQVFDHDPP